MEKPGVRIIFVDVGMDVNGTEQKKVRAPMLCSVRVRICEQLL